MRLLLDECVDRRFARELPGHDVQTLQFEQNVGKLEIGVLILRAKTNRLQDLKPLAPLVLKALPTLRMGQVVTLVGTTP